MRSDRDEPDGADGAVAPFVVAGEVDDVVARRLGLDLARYCAETGGDVHLDCSALTFISSGGLSTVLGVRLRVLRDGRDLYFTNVTSPWVREVLEISGLGDLIR